MPIFAKALLIGVALGVVFGAYVARRSQREEPIHGGMLAQIFHYVGTVSFVSALPTVLAAVIMGGGFRVALPLAIMLLALTYLALFCYALIERPARPVSTDDEGWTEEKARTSGL
jgi:hypothetical protein